MTWPLDVARYLTLNYYHHSHIRLISTMATVRARGGGWSRECGKSGQRKRMLVGDTKGGVTSSNLGSEGARMLKFGTRAGLI